MMYKLIAVVSIVLVLPVTVAAGGLTVDVESGVAFNGYNDVRIPGNTGSDISLTDDLNAERTEYFRIRATYALGDRHQLTALVAPLRIEASGRINRPIDYNGVSFAADQQLRARYRFDSYRLTYRYALVSTSTLRFSLGFTAKVRDASISISGDSQSSEKTNTGFVPLISFALDWSMSPGWGLLLQGDALAAPQGRAEDVLLAVYTDTGALRWRVGYRVLEGGADNDEVYNFTLVHFLSAGVTLRL